MSSQPILKVLSPGSNAVFMCSKCIDRVSKLKLNIRRSTDTANAVQTDKDNPHQQSTKPIDEKETFSNITSILEKMNENFLKVKESNDNLKVLIANKSSDAPSNINISTFSTIEHNLTTLLAKFDQHLSS